MELGLESIRILYIEEKIPILEQKIEYLNNYSIVLDCFGCVFKIFVSYPLYIKFESHGQLLIL